MNAFASAFLFEWRKTRRGAALWLIVVGACFTPAIVLVARLLAPAKLPQLYASGDFWTSLWTSAWESMAIFLLPMAAILATSLTVHLEWRNDAWKQLHTLPLSPAALFFAKLAMALVIVAAFLVLFDVAIVLSAFAPALVFERVPFPTAQMPVGSFARQTTLYFVDASPIIVATYLLALSSRNFLVPIGVGFLAWVAALAALSSSFGIWVPYAYTLMNYLQQHPSARAMPTAHHIHEIAIAYAAVFVAAAYVSFVLQPRKG
jgi:hypothetical protein